MSDTPQGPDWWRASDGRWYPPQGHAPGAPPPRGSATTNLTPGVLVVAIAAGVAFLASFAPLLSGTSADTGAKVTVSSWNKNTREFTILALLSLLVLVFALIKIFGSFDAQRPVLGFTMGQWCAVVGFVGIVVSFGQLIDDLQGATREFGLFMELIASIGMAVGGIMLSLEGATGTPAQRI